MLITATAGIVLPPCLTSKSAGAAERSASQISWCTTWKCHRYLPVFASAATMLVAEEIVAGAIAAVLIDRGCAERHVDDAALDVDGDEAPDVDAGAILPAVARPRVVELLARLRNRSERPHQLAGSARPRPHIAQRPARRVLLVAAAGDDEVLVDGRRRAQADGPGHALEDLGGVHVDAALVAEGLGWLAGLGIERVEPAVTGGEDHLRRCTRISGPVFDAARRGIAGRHLKDPDFLARGRVERHHAPIRRRDVHHAVDDERRGLARGKARAAASSAAPLCRCGLPGPAAAAGGCGRACDRPRRPAAGRRWRG